MHYFRLPHPDLWWDRLQKLKAAGYNTVDLYFSWDFHSPAPGQYDFTGVRDIARLIKMTQDLGLYLIARPGPYINAETTRGGLPGWLMKEPDVILRNRENGVYHYSPRYMQFVKEWLDQVLPFLKDQPNLLMIQVENEYSTLDMEPEYMQELAQHIRSQGITAPTMHNDFYAAGLYEDLVDIYAIDNYTVTATDLDWRAYPDLFSVIDHLEEGVRPEFCVDRPLMIAELQAGWFAGWKGVPYDTIANNLGRDHISLVTRSFIGQGGTIFNHYKAIGGTNWGHMGATDVYTSYDFTAPISETGLVSERLYEAKRINLLLQHFDLTQSDPVDPEEWGLKAQEGLYKCRKTEQGGWAFTRNTSTTDQAVRIGPYQVITKPYRAKILPYGLTLQNNWQIIFSDVEPLAQTPHLLVLSSETDTTVVFKTQQATQPAQISPCLAWESLNEAENTWVLSVNGQLPQDEIAQAQFEDYTIVVLPDALADRLWKTESGYWIGPDQAINDDAVYTDGNTPIWRLSAQGKLQSVPKPNVSPISLPELTNWQFYQADQPNPHQWQALSPNGTDMDSNGIHEGAVWYQFDVPEGAKTLTLHAQNNWAVLCNGQVLASGQTFHVHPDKGSPEDQVSVTLPGNGELRVYVESLGHHKGFYDDTRDPRGIISIQIDGQPLPGGKIQPAITHTPNENDLRPLTQSPITFAKTTFSLNLPSQVMAPVGLIVKDLPFERVNISVNGVLIGKYWQSCQNQTHFYLPQGILNHHGSNTLELAVIGFENPLSCDALFPPAQATLQLASFGQFIKV